MLLIEQNAPGGQAGTSSMIENYLGFPNGVTGADLARRAAMQAKRFGTEVLVGHSAVGIRRHDPYKVVQLSNGEEVVCHALLLSTGMAVRELDAPGLAPLIGAGVYYGAALSEAAIYRGQHVFVLGGANSAGQGALFFARYAAQVTLIVRKPTLHPAMSHYLVDRINEHGEHHRARRHGDRRRARQRPPRAAGRPQRRDGPDQQPRGERAVHLHRRRAADRGLCARGRDRRQGIHPHRRRRARRQASAGSSIATR